MENFIHTYILWVSKYYAYMNWILLLVLLMLVVWAVNEMAN